MNNKVVFGQYYNENSWIHKLDPRTKLLSLMALMIAIFLIDNIIILSIVLFMVFILICTSKVPIGRFLNSLKMMVTLLIFTTFFQVIFNTNGRIIKEYELQLNILNLSIIIILFTLYFTILKNIKKFRIIQLLIILFLCFYVQIVIKYGFVITNYKITIFDDGLISAIKIIVRIISLLFLSSLLTLTTKPTDLNNGLEKLLYPLTFIKVKVNILTMMISIALRFIPTLINEADKILKAQASRGVDFKEGKIKDKVTQIISLIIPMFVISYKKADDLANAMEARGYDPDSKRTSINQIKYELIDYFILAFSCICLILVVGLKIANAI